MTARIVYSIALKSSLLENDCKASEVGCTIDFNVLDWFLPYLFKQNIIAMTKIRRETISYAKYPTLETKERLTKEEWTTRAKLLTLDEPYWFEFIEDYHYFSTVASSSPYVS